MTDIISEEEIIYLLVKLRTPPLHTPNRMITTKGLDDGRKKKTELLAKIITKFVNERRSDKCDKCAIEYSRQSGQFQRDLDTVCDTCEKKYTSACNLFDCPLHKYTSGYRQVTGGPIVDATK